MRREVKESHAKENLIPHYLLHYYVPCDPNFWAGPLEIFCAGHSEFLSFYMPGPSSWKGWRCTAKIGGSGGRFKESKVGTALLKWWRVMFYA